MHWGTWTVISVLTFPIAFAIFSLIKDNVFINKTLYWAVTISPVHTFTSLSTCQQEWLYKLQIKPHALEQEHIQVE